MGDPLRVLHVVVNMNRGGAETLIMNLYRNIDRTKIQFDFLTCKEGVFDSEIIDMGGNVHQIPYVTEVGHHSYIRELRRFLQENPTYKIIHAHLDKMSGFVLKAAKQANVPVRISHSHNTESEGTLPAKVYKWYAGSQIKSSATHQFACSRAAAKWLFGSEYEEAFILKNGIELDTFQFSTADRAAMRKELQLKEETFVLGHVGRFSHQKNHLFLLEVFSIVSEKLPHAKLLLVGDGPLNQEIKQKIKKLNLEEKVSLLGIQENINRLLQAFDLFVFPSVHEGLPVTLIEAQGAGLPCLISEAITTEVDMGIGLVQYLPIIDADVWAEKIVQITKTNQKREVQQTNLVKKGYDIRKTAKDTQSTYLALGGDVI